MSNPVPMSPTSTPPPRSPRRRLIRSAAIGTVIAVVVAGIGWKAAAFGHGMGGWHRGGLMGAALDPARLDERLDHLLRHLYVEVDATDAQKQRLGRAEAGGGAGLGLALVRQIARHHGGDARYQGRRDGRSCFVVTLPAAR
jgi:histidine kinase/DNA gyrase B/HSP90-like ATPase